ncbi:MAG: RraA family protein [Puniceicoccales bacterium]|jgi:RraA family protein|nr:RraA family protein [Puniceicoccales bacterium]
MIDIGNRIITTIERPRQNLIDQFRGIPSSNIGDMMNRLYCMRSYIKAMTDRPLLGTAFTVKAPDGDNVFLHRALDLAAPGDVIVVDGGGCINRSLMGEIMFTYAQQRGISGFVLDGAIRDVDSLSHLSISVYARSVTPQGPYKNGPGEINVPISCGGQVVMPGDIIAGDADGICVIRASEAEKIVEAVRKKFADEQIQLEQYNAGILNQQKHEDNYIAVTSKINTVYY